MQRNKIYPTKKKQEFIANQEKNRIFRQWKEKLLMSAFFTENKQYFKRIVKKAGNYKGDDVQNS